MGTTRPWAWASPASIVLLPEGDAIAMALGVWLPGPSQTLVVGHLPQGVDNLNQVLLGLHHLVDVFVSKGVLVEETLGVPVPGLTPHRLHQ